MAHFLMWQARPEEYHAAAEQGQRKGPATCAVGGKDLAPENQTFAKSFGIHFDLQPCV